MLNLRTVSDELLSDSLVRNLRAAHMNEYGEWRLARDDSVAAPVYLFNHLPRRITSLVEQQRNLVGKPEEQNLPLRLDLLPASDSDLDDEGETRVCGRLSLKSCNERRSILDILITYPQLLLDPSCQQVRA